MDCSQADAHIGLLTYLIQQTQTLFWIYPTLWAMVLTRKIFYS